METSSAVCQLSRDSYRSHTQFSAFLRRPNQAVRDLTLILEYSVQFSQHKIRIRCSIKLDLYLPSHNKTYVNLSNLSRNQFSSVKRDSPDTLLTENGRKTKSLYDFS